MKISNSKKELAKIISESGGWRDGADSCSCDNDGYVNFFKGKPTRNYWSWLDNGDCEYLGGIITPKYEKIKNWHQTILSRAEYFHLYPAPDADGWIEWSGGFRPVRYAELVDVKYANGTVERGFGAGGYAWNWSGDGLRIIAYRLHKPEQAKPEFCESVTRSIQEPETKPSIESLAADYRNKLDYANRKQDEAEKAKVESNAALSELEKAIAAIGFAITPIGAAAQEPEMVITDWRDLMVGDIVEISGSKNERWLRFKGVELFVSRTGTAECSLVFRTHDGDEWGHGGNTHWRFIRRPAK